MVATTLRNLGLVSLLASSVLAAPSRHMHRHARRQDVVVTDVVAVTQYVYATAPAAQAPAPAAAAATPAAVAAAPDADSEHDLTWGDFHHGEQVSSVVAPVTSILATPAPAPQTTLVTRASSSAAAAPSSAPSSSPSKGNGNGNSSGGKRGVAYNSASLTDLFTGSTFSWAYNWACDAAGSLPSSLEYVPMLWGNRADFTGPWTAAVQTALAAGSTHLLGFNEPDHTAQANMSPSDAASAWTANMEPYAGKAKLVSPAVTNGAAPMGLAWLGEFMSACSSCTVDAVAIHWYDAATNIDYFKQHVTDAHTQFGKPVWITEFGATGSDDQISSFLSEVLPWLDSQDFVERYAYFMADDGHLLSGGSLSTYGQTYVNAA